MATTAYSNLNLFPVIVLGIGIFLINLSFVQSQSQPPQLPQIPPLRLELPQIQLPEIPEVLSRLNPIPAINNVISNIQNTQPEDRPPAGNTYRDTLDPEAGLYLSWSVNRNTSTILFTIEANNRNGYVALALTKQGRLQGADVILVGLRQADGTPYVLDMYGVDNDTIALDQRQDWRLEMSNSSQSNNSNQGIRISIRRSLDTCDPQDMRIGEEQIAVLHAVFGSGGATSNITTQFDPDKARKLYFFDPFILPTSSNVNVENMRMWRLSRRYVIPPRPTSYWCSIHKMTPSLPTRHHISGFNVYLADEAAKRHVHHQILYRCVPPVGSSAEAIFEPYINYPGEECYVNERPTLPSAYCREMVHIFAIGGQPVFFPESTGLNIGGAANEYFMFETHISNDNLTGQGTVVENGVDIYYTPEIRPNDGSIFLIGHGVLGTFVVPPNTSNFSMAGHCSKECTMQMIPAGGMDVVQISLHAHTSTRRMRVRHWRGNNELPWIINDDEYDFQYQQIRNLESPRRIMPGDQLTVECGYDTNWKEGQAVASGFSTKMEMCMAFWMVSKPLSYMFCASELNTDRTMQRFGIQNMTWDLQLHERRINAALNPDYVGLTLSQIVESQSWPRERIEELERDQRYGSHVASCANMRIMGAAYYYGTGFQNLTGGLIQIPLLEQAVPTNRAIRSPLPVPFPTRYPGGGRIYTPPPSTCPPRPPEAGNANGGTLQQQQNGSRQSQPNAGTVPMQGQQSNLRQPNFRG